MFGDKHCGFNKSLRKRKIHMDTLEDRREHLCLNFTLKVTKTKEQIICSLNRKNYMHSSDILQSFSLDVTHGN